MKKYILSMSLVLLTGVPAFAGGVFCKECPAENNTCIPRNCEEATNASSAKCTSQSALNEILKSKTQTAAGACCSWGENISGCFKGC